MKIIQGQYIKWENYARMNEILHPGSLPEIAPRPFVKWAGGKGQLLSELASRTPTSYGRYFEPFLGGGALFFNLLPPNAYLADINHELTNAYRQVRSSHIELVEMLKDMPYDEDFFYEIRKADRSVNYPSWSGLKKASRLIYLNRTCFNGLYRVNSKGQFNVSFGDYRSPTICDAQNLKACSVALQGAELYCAPFQNIEDIVQPGDFVYLDPPYVPTTTTSNFTGYSRGGFAENEQQALRDMCARLDRKKARWMLSNSHSPVTMQLYADFHIELVQASRTINSNAKGRGKVNEIIVRNYS